MSKYDVRTTPELDNDIEEMFARADILWGRLNDRTPEPELKEFFGSYYEAMLHNMWAVRDALVAAYKEKA